jgi:hypothetical protein
MLLLVFRALNAVFAVVVAILVSMRWGDSNLGKLVTVIITASVVAFAEWLLLWAPKHWEWARRRLDPRSIFTGVWIEEDVHVLGDGRNEQIPNRFGIFAIDYQEETDTYAVDGRAYNKVGKEHARFWSVEAKPIHFAKNGRSMTYLFDGTITNPNLKSSDPRRTGLTRMDLVTDDAGTGRVDHVALNVTLEFNLRRVTKEWLAEHELSRFLPEKLREPDVRDDFAEAFARRTDRRAAAG